MPKADVYAMTGDPATVDIPKESGLGNAAEGGLELLTFYDFSKQTWKSIRTTNTIENLNREFRRRTTTQASFSTEHAALTVLYGLVAFGQIQLRKIDGYQSCLRLSRRSGRKSREVVKWSTVNRLVTSSANIHKTRDGSQTATDDTGSQQ